MNTIHLRYFCEIIKCGSINKAAKNLYLNHSSLVYAINELEKEIGSQLLIRNKSGVKPTEKGQKVFEDAQRVLSIINTWSASEPQSQIPITMNAAPSMYYTYLDALVFALNRKFHNLRISTNCMLNYELNKGTFSFTGYDSSQRTQKNILINLVATNNIVEYPLFKSTYVVYANCKHPLTKQKTIFPSDIRRYTAYAISHSQLENSVFYELYMPSKIVYLPNMTNIMNLIERSDGITVLPFHLQYFHSLVNPNKICALPIEGYKEYFQLSLYYSSDIAQNTKLKPILNFIKTYPYIKDNELVFD